ncbi:receptor-like protein kinase, partial [Trifolium pratense]
MSYNKDIVFSNDNLFSYFRINIPFPCECIGGEFLGHVFEYSSSEGDTYDLIANTYYASLTTVEISKDYGLFITYPLRARDNLQKIASDSELDEGVIQSFNSGVNFSKGSGIVFIPGR